MAPDYLVYGRFDLLGINRRVEAPNHRKIVERVFGVQLLKEPDALLREREA